MEKCSILSDKGDVMKRILLVLWMCFIWFFGVSAQAHQYAQEADPMKWEISMQPKPTAEEIEAARWSVIVENDIGIYAYDMGSFAFEQDDKDEYDKNLVNVLVKTVFTNKEVLQKLKKDYSNKLEGKEKVLYCKMDMQYNMKEESYVVKTMQVFTNTDRQIDVKKNKRFAPVPEKSFAEALYEVCQKFVVHIERAEALAEHRKEESK